MKKKYAFIAILFIAGNVFSKGDSHSPQSSIPKNEPVLNGSGLCFTPNKGQVADMNGTLCPDILYTGDGGGADIYLRKTGISYVYTNMGEVQHRIDEQVEDLIKAGVISEAEEHQKKNELISTERIKIHRVDMDFAGSNKNCRTVNEKEVDGYRNFYYAHCPNGITNVHQYNKVTYKNIYNNIDVSYYGDKQKGIKYDIIVQPHADPNQIKLHWSGAESIHINREGNLVIKTSVNEFTESIPKVYQNINGEIVDIKTKYVLMRISEGETIINFSFSIFNPSFPLVVDPWATYYGGTSRDEINGIAADYNENVVIVGATASLDFPIGPGSVFQAGFKGFVRDAFIVKFNKAGALQWATYYGGRSGDFGTDITTDNIGNVLITGRTISVDLPILVGGAGYSQTLIGSYDVFVVKFSPAGARIWDTYYGGSDTELFPSIATDNAGNVFIAGQTRSADLPVLAGGGYFVPFVGADDIFITKFSSGGTLLWATFYGTKNGGALDIATDIAGNVVVTGETQSASFPTGKIGANIVFQAVFGGGVFDVFVVKFNNTGVRQWATFYGGTSWEYAPSIATDNAGNIIITGENDNSGSFPVGAVAGNYVYQTVSVGGSDAFVVKFDPTGTRLWATFYGGIKNERFSYIATDGNSNIYLLMEAEDAATPDLVDTCSWQPVFGGIEDQLIVKFSPVGKKVCTTYMGGNLEDELEGMGGIAISGNSLYITGFTYGNYPVTSGAFQTTFIGGDPNDAANYDLFVASLCTNICEGKTSLGIGFTAATSVCANAPVTFTPTVSNSCDTSGYKFYWIFTGGNPSSSNLVNPTVTFSGVGTHDVKLVVTTLCKKDSLTKSNYITTTQCAVCNLTAQFSKGTASCLGCGCKEWILVNATGGTSPYTYLWPDGYDKRYKNQLCPGSYTVNIKDKIGCSVNIKLTAP